MSKILTDNQYYYQIANVIREQNGTNNTYTPPQMVSALKDLFYEEVEGAPPITFQGIGENLLDYRIDGASGGVGERTKNLFNFNEWSENLTANENNELIISNNSITITAVGKDAFTIPYYANHPNIYKIDVLPNSQYVLSWDSNNTLPGVIYVFKNGLTGSGNYVSVNNATRKYITFSTDGNTTFITIRFGVMNAGNSITYSHIQLEEGSTVTDYEPYGYKIPVVMNGKNLLQNNATSQTKNGVTFTVNEDGSVTCNGTNHGNDTIIFELNYPGVVLPEGVYITSGCPAGGSQFGGYKIQYNNGSSWYYEVGSGSTFTLSGSLNYRSRILISKDVTVTNLTFYPMLRKADITDDTYEPYIEPTTTNIYLDEPIGAKANIPSEYEEVEYIESTGTQYIDTNYTPVRGDDLEFKNVTINTFNGALFSAGIESYQLILLGLGSVCYYKYFQVGNAVASSFSTITNENIKVLNGNLYINNVLKAEANYGGAVDTTLNIFRRADNTSNLIGKIGEIIISNNGIIKRDFIPCYRKSDNVAGLYDLVNNTFYTNQGTGNFIVGPIKENESISLSDTNTNIPTIRGTNVLTVDTTVQPSNVYVKARKESSYETAIREDYEEELSDIESEMKEV